MPPRRKPTSTKQKKADQQLKRAIKRGDVPPPDPKSKSTNRKRKTRVRLGPTGQLIGSSNSTVTANVESARRLQSSFIKLPPTFLEDTKLLASKLRLPRPITVESVIFNDLSNNHEVQLPTLTCPRRPKWRFDMTKVEVERNEEGLFKKWLIQTDEAVGKWQEILKAPLSDNTDDQPEIEPKMPASPTYFERNLEVWRQLWRVTEISQIILVLLDSRCPLLHYPPSLSAYLADRKVILVLTKVDITGPVRVQAWISYIKAKHPNIPIVQVESYVEKDARAEHQGRRQYAPHIPENFRRTLVETIREVHNQMLEPPEKVKNNPNWLQKWVAPVRRIIDWEAVLKADGTKVGTAVGGAAVPRSNSNAEEDQEPEFLTVGLIGQPNVGKSSLLNALFGIQRVRASKTPGKTKHFQTLYWTQDVRLVDCPGLVMPNFVPMEMQVLCGILPISRISAIPSCIHFASCLLPLEQIFKLVHPINKAVLVEDKRTWREGTRPRESEDKSLAWTAMDILTAYADDKGWVTAKAGRPDIHRAGNALLRALAEGRVSWGFWPSLVDQKLIASEGEDDSGIWISRTTPVDFESGTESEEDKADDTSSISEQEELKDEEGESEEDVTTDVRASRFAALAILQGEEQADEDAVPNTESDDSGEEPEDQDC